MELPKPIMDLSERFEFLLSGQATYGDIVDFNYKVTSNNILLFAEIPDWKELIIKYVIDFLPSKLKELHDELPKIIEETKKSVPVFKTKKYSFYEKVDSNSTGSEQTEFSHTVLQNLESEDKSVLNKHLLEELHHYQEALINTFPTRKPIGNNEIEQLIFNISVHQLGAFIRILLETKVLEKNQWEDNKTEYSKTITAIFNTAKRMKGGENISSESLNQAIQTPPEKDIDILISKFREMNIEAANLKLKMEAREDRPAASKKDEGGKIKQKNS